MSYKELLSVTAIASHILQLEHYLTANSLGKIKVLNQADSGIEMTFSQTLFVSIATASLIGLLILFVQYITVLLQRLNDKNQPLEQEKRAVYKYLLKLVYDLLGLIVSGKTPSDEVDDDIFKIERDLTVYASDEVFRLFIELRKISDQKQDVLKPIAKLILAIRRELGHEDTTISLREIVMPVVRDSKELLEKL